MAQTIIDNINSILNTKSELQSILVENGQEGGEVFSDYPAQFRSAIASGGSDLSNYPTFEDIAAMSYVTNNQLQSASYVTMSDVSACGYITANEIPTIQVPVIDESIVPKENNTYTLGNSNYYYSYTYTYNLTLNTHNIKWDEYSIGFQINGNSTMRMFQSSFRPWVDKGATLGSSSNQWSTTYTYNLYSPTLTLSYSYNSIENSSNTRINFKINQNNRFKMTNVEFAPVTNNGVNLGTSSEQFNKTYTGTLFLNGNNIEDRFTYLIWTGTSAQYAALPNYTTYQIYMIEKDVN